MHTGYMLEIASKGSRDVVLNFMYLSVIQSQ